MNKLMFAIAVTFALIACANISVIAEQGNIAKQVNTKCQDRAWYLGTLNLTMGSCRIYNLSFVPGEKEITLYVEKDLALASTDAYVIFNITVKPGSIPTILWWKLGRPIKTGDGGFGVEVFIPNYLADEPYETNVSVEGYLDFIFPLDKNERTITATLKVGALFGGRITEDGYTVHLIRVED